MAATPFVSHLPPLYPPHQPHPSTTPSPPTHHPTNQPSHPTCRSSRLLEARQKGGTKAPRNWRKAGRSPSPAASRRRCSRICRTRGQGQGAAGRQAQNLSLAAWHEYTHRPARKARPSTCPAHPLQLLGAVGGEGHLLGWQLRRRAVQVAPAGPGRGAQQQQRHLGPRVLARPHQTRQQVAARQPLGIVQHQPGAAAPPPRGLCTAGGMSGRAGCGAAARMLAAAGTDGSHPPNVLPPPHAPLPAAPGSCSLKSAIPSHLMPHS